MWEYDGSNCDFDNCDNIIIVAIVKITVRPIIFHIKQTPHRGYRHVIIEIIDKNGTSLAF